MGRGTPLPHGSLRCGWTVPAAPRLRRLSTRFAGLGVLRSKSTSHATESGPHNLEAGKGVDGKFLIGSKAQRSEP
jgi:hypothetical protein